jgi:hypothetical protein
MQHRISSASWRDNYWITLPTWQRMFSWDQSNIAYMTHKKSGIEYYDIDIFKQHPYTVQEADNSLIVVYMMDDMWS